MEQDFSFFLIQSEWINLLNKDLSCKTLQLIFLFLNIKQENMSFCYTFKKEIFSIFFWINRWVVEKWGVGDEVVVGDKRGLPDGIFEEVLQETSEFLAICRLLRGNIEVPGIFGIILKSLGGFENLQKKHSDYSSSFVKLSGEPGRLARKLKIPPLWTFLQAIFLNFLDF